MSAHWFAAMLNCKTRKTNTDKNKVFLDLSKKKNRNRSVPIQPILMTLYHLKS